jgi:NlpC/P60 family putative phage cell wall peptidase
MPTRDQIITAARDYLGTPFHHQGRLKGVGIDCIGLLTGVAQELGITHHDFQGYSRHPDGVTLTRELTKAGLIPITVDEARPGDVIVFWITRPTLPCHAGILTYADHVIHTWSTIGQVVEHPYDDAWRKRVACAFRFPGVVD